MNQVQAQVQKTRTLTSAQNQNQNQRKSIPTKIQKIIFQRDKCCQYLDPKTGRKCASRNQLEVDHRRPVWADGGNEIENLQLLCRAHNRYQYQKELKLF